MGRKRWIKVSFKQFENASEIKSTEVKCPENGSFDPRKRIEPSKQGVESKDNFDPGERVKIHEKGNVEPVRATECSMENSDSRLPEIGRPTEAAADHSDNSGETENTGKKGGSYGELRKETSDDNTEIHHMPADSASPLERNDGPAIKMDKEDHRQTASCGNSRESREYRDKQKELIEQGKFREAIQMDIDDIHEKFGDKYDDAISEMNEYVDKLEQEGQI